MGGEGQNGDQISAPKTQNFIPAAFRTFLMIHAIEKSYLLFNID